VNKYEHEYEYEKTNPLDNKFFSPSCLVFRLLQPTYFTCRKYLLHLITVNAHTHSIGLLWTTVWTITEASTWQHTTLTTDSHPCPRQYSKLQSQQRCSCRLTHYTAWPLGSAWVFLTQTNMIFAFDVLLSIFKVFSSISN